MITVPSSCSPYKSELSFSPRTRNFRTCSSTGRYFYLPYSPVASQSISRGRAVFPDEGLPIPYAFRKGEWPWLPFPARIERYSCSLRACSFPLQGWGLIDLPLRATFSPAHLLADIFHPPYPPIASQSISRDVPVARARGACDGALREHRRSSGFIPSSILRARRAPGRSPNLS